MYIGNVQFGNKLLLLQSLHAVYTSSTNKYNAASPKDPNITYYWRVHPSSCSCETSRNVRGVFSLKNETGCDSNQGLFR